MDEKKETIVDNPGQKPLPAEEAASDPETSSEKAGEETPLKEKQKEVRSKKELTPQQIQQRKKMMVYPLMLLAFAGCMYLIFAPPSSGTEGEQTTGFNPELPMPGDGSLVSDKIKAYEQENLSKGRDERIRTLEDFMLDDFKKKKDAPLDIDLPQESEPSQKQSSISSSQSAYRNMNQQLNSFYQERESSGGDEQKILELEWRIQELERGRDDTESAKKVAEEQMELMEKSYQMASKYMGGLPAGQAAIAAPVTSAPKDVTPNDVKAVHENEVTTLPREISDSAFIAAYSRPRNTGFNTAVGSGYSLPRNTIRACVHTEQTVMSGQSVWLRLLEPMQTGEIIIPKNSLISGTAKIQGERVDIVISSLEYAGNIIPVELAVHDSDGTKGIYVPSSLEREAMNEAMANIGAGLGSSFSFAQNSGQQITMDVTRGLMQGASGYLGKKFRTQKATLKAGHQVMLYTKER